MRGRWIGLSAVVLVASGGAARGQSEQSINACHNRTSTADISGCLAGQIDLADKHLNTAYQALMKKIDASGRDPLRAAERAWLEYRKQRCDYLTAGLGTLANVVAADCVLDMTMARATELDHDAVGPGGQ